MNNYLDDFDADKIKTTIEQSGDNSKSIQKPSSNILEHSINNENDDDESLIGIELFGLQQENDKKE